MLISQPDSSTMRLMFFPPGPINSPIRSGLIFKVMMRGAYLLNSDRGAASVSVIFFKMTRRATRAFSTASAINAWGSPGSLRSS